MPASGRFLLDTNIIIALLDGEESVLSNIDLAPEVFIPAVVVGELFSGPRNPAVRLRTLPGWSDSQPAGPLSQPIWKSRGNTGDSNTP